MELDIGPSPLYIPWGYNRGEREFMDPYQWKTLDLAMKTVCRPWHHVYSDMIFIRTTLVESNTTINTTMAWHSTYDHNHHLSFIYISVFHFHSTILVFRILLICPLLAYCYIHICIPVTLNNSSDLDPVDHLSSSVCHLQPAMRAMSLSSSLTSIYPILQRLHLTR